MPLGKRLSLVEQGQLDLMIQLGWSLYKMSAHVGRSRCCIRNYMKNPVQYGINTNPGRKQKLSAREKREICRLASNSTKSANEIIRELNLQVSKQTVLRTIRSNPQLVRQTMRAAPRLTDKHKLARKDFAKCNMKTEWKKVSNV